LMVLMVFHMQISDISHITCIKDLNTFRTIVNCPKSFTSNSEL